MCVLDDKFLKAYRKWLGQFFDLHDCAYRTDDGEFNRWRDDELEAFRNEPSLAFVEKLEGRYTRRAYRSDLKPTLDDLAAHCVHHEASTIYATATASDEHEEMLLLLDIDAKDGTGDAEGAAKYISAAYFSGRTYTECSTFGKGRHVYFKLDVRVTGVTHGLDRSDLYETFTRLLRAIQSDGKLSTYGVVVDDFYGLPSCWQRRNGRLVITRRGNCLKLPYLDGDWADLERLQALPALSYERLLDAPILAPVGTAKAAPKPSDHGIDLANSFQRMHKACSRFRQSYGRYPRDEAELCDHYEALGLNADDIRDRPRIKRARAVLAYQRETEDVGAVGHRHGFKPGEHLDVVKRLVPNEALTWKRRETLSHERLADFIGIKLQDAFAEPCNGYFAQSSRDACISLTRKLKAEKTLSWSLTPNTYSKLLTVAEQYRLLETFEASRRPMRCRSSKRKLLNGKPALVGPGTALDAIRGEWLPLYEAWKNGRSSMTGAA